MFFYWALSYRPAYTVLFTGCCARLCLPPIAHLQRRWRSPGDSGRRGRQGILGAWYGIGHGVLATSAASVDVNVCTAARQAM